ncbi:MAG: hypothetical protein BWY19_01132 [bacterium ADurb.Bin212]|jgi:prepilin-type N-terminal cleavage/methylation domain-containing protein|nr:MAG: hypothetical protein BWY19_01132 [bacterium ADurb.Bin212]
MQNSPERWMLLKLLIKQKRGFTLIEITIVIFIMAMLSLLVATLLANSFKSYRQGLQGVRMQDSAAKILRDFENKTRGAEEIVLADSDELSFYAYIAGDTRPAPSFIRYFVENGALMRGIISPEGEGPVYFYPPESEVFVDIADGIINPNEIFSYYSDSLYDYSNDSATLLSFPVTLADIKMVRISIEIDYDTAKPPVAADETTIVNLRNLKRNL